MRKYVMLGALNGAVIGFSVLTANVVIYTYISNRLALSIVGFDDYANIYWPVVTNGAQVRWWVIGAGLAVLLMLGISLVALRGVSRGWITAVVVSIAVGMAASSFGSGTILFIGEIIRGPHPIFPILTAVITVGLAFVGAVAMWFLVRQFNLSTPEQDN